MTATLAPCTCWRCFSIRNAINELRSWDAFAKSNGRPRDPEVVARDLQRIAEGEANLLDHATRSAAGDLSYLG